MIENREGGGELCVAVGMTHWAMVAAFTTLQGEGEEARGKCGASGGSQRLQSSISRARATCSAAPRRLPHLVENEVPNIRVVAPEAIILIDPRTRPVVSDVPDDKRVGRLRLHEQGALLFPDSELAAAVSALSRVSMLLGCCSRANDTSVELVDVS